MSGWTIPPSVVQQIANAFYVEYRRSCEATLRLAGVSDGHIEQHLAAIDVAFRRAGVAL